MRASRPVVGLTLAATFVALLSAPANSTEVGARVVWSEVQPRLAGVVGAAELDGNPGDEVVMASLSGGLYAGRADGSVLWRYPTPDWTRASVVDDLDGDDRSDVVAQVGFPKMQGRLVALSGATGGTIFAKERHSPVGAARTDDLNGDGHLDVVTPSVDGPIRLAAWFGPTFTDGWTVMLPGNMDGYWVFAESIATGDLDGDGAAEVAFGTRLPGNAGGKIVVLNGATGATRWSADTGSVFSLKIADRSLVAYVWYPAGVTFRGELSAYGAQGGSPLWTRPVPGFVKSGPVVVADLQGDGTSEIVLATGVAQEGTLAFGLDPSNQLITAVGVGDGSVRWTAKVVRDVSSIIAIPRAGGGADVIYGTDGWLSGYVDEYVGRLDGRTGAPAWLRVHSGDSFDERISGIVLGDLAAPAGREVVYAHPDHKVTALSASDGTVASALGFPGLWGAAAAGDVDGDGSVDIFGGGAEGVVRAVDERGSARWSVRPGGVIGGLHLSGGSLLVAAVGVSARALALDRATGSERWSVATGVVANYPYASHHQAFGDLDGDGIDDVVIGGHQNSRPTVVAYSGRTGSLLWRALSPVLPVGSHPASTIGQVASVSVVNGDVLAVIQGALEHEVTPRLALIRGTTGGAVWTTTAAVDEHFASARRLGDKLVVAHGDRYLSGRDPATGTEAWTEDLGRPHILVPWSDRILAIARPFAAARKFSVSVIGPTGRERVTAEDALPAATAASLVDGVGVVVATPEGTLVLDPAALAEGRVEVVDEFHLPEFINLNGTTFQMPTVTTIVPGRDRDGAFALGANDPLVASGTGSGIPGAWLARF